MSTLALDGVTPRSRTIDPTTSVDAGRSVTMRASQAEVIRLLLLANRPLADHQLVAYAAAHSRKDYTPQRIRSARAELAEVGTVVQVDGEFVQTPRGRRAHVWRLA